MQSNVNTRLLEINVSVVTKAVAGETSKRFVSVKCSAEGMGANKQKIAST